MQYIKQKIIFRYKKTFAKNEKATKMTLNKKVVTALGVKFGHAGVTLLKHGNFHTILVFSRDVVLDEAMCPLEA